MLLSKILNYIKNGESKYLNAYIVSDIEITGAESFENASVNQISFLEANNELKNNIEKTFSSVVIVNEDFELIPTLRNKNISVIVVSYPRIAFAEVLNLLYKEPDYEVGIDNSAKIHNTALIGEQCSIGANVYIGKNCKIGSRNKILPGAIILENVAIGDNNIIHPNCVIYGDTTIKNNCIINSNSVIGSEGFGFIPKDDEWIKMPQKGGVIIDNRVEIGTNCCVDRPVIGFTIIGEGTKIDNLVQIGHGVKIGKNCAFAAQVGIAGGAVIGDGVILAGQVGVNNRVKVGNKVIASSKCGIHCDIEDGLVVSGFPAMANKSWLKSSSVFKKLPELAKKLRQLDKN